MTSQLSQPKTSISARDMGRNGAVPKRSAQWRRYPVMSSAVCMVRRGLDQKQRNRKAYLGGLREDVKGTRATPRQSGCAAPGAGMADPGATAARRQIAP